MWQGLSYILVLRSEFVRTYIASHELQVKTTLIHGTSKSQLDSDVKLREDQP